MNRVIEFRVWDEGYKQMYYAKNGYAPVSYFGLSNSDLVASTMANKHHLMQFSGLHDKNGKKIFERDILKDKNGIVSIVEYRNCEFVKNDRISVPPLFASSGYLQIEVIGNLYENPDLCN
jgi:uncharacterized phage protein (TIGR01671 family)